MGRPGNSNLPAAAEDHKGECLMFWAQGGENLSGPQGQFWAHVYGFQGA